MQLLIRLRPGVFTPEEQADYEGIREGISSTAWLAVAAFVANSGFRYWQIRSNNRSALYGLSAILACYMPAMIYYKWQVQKETYYIRELSEKYRDRIDDSKLTAFIETIPKDDYGLTSFMSKSTAAKKQ